MTSHSQWDKTTGAIEVAAALTDSIKGRTIVLTGVSPKSIGAAAAVAIAAQRPSQLILVSRSLSKINAVIDDIHREHADVKCRAVTADFSSLASARAAAEQVKKHTSIQGIDVLINNAGISVPFYEITPEGFELQWATNHLGPFVFTKELLGSLRSAASASGSAARVINVSSDGHALCPIRFSDPNFHLPIDALPEEEHPAAGRIGRLLPKPGETYSGFLGYGQSKTANVLMALHISHAFGAEGIVGLSLHPGSIWTNLPRHLDADDTKFIAATSKFWKTLDQGAATTLVAAFDPKLQDCPGAYLSDCQLATPAPHASRREAAERLWRLTEQATHDNRSVL